MKYFDAVLEILINVYLWLCIFFAVFYCVNAAFGAEVKIPQNAFKYREYLIKESRFVWGIEAPSATFAAQIHTESGWNEKAKWQKLTRITPTGQSMPWYFITSIILIGYKPLIWQTKWHLPYPRTMGGLGGFYAINKRQRSTGIIRTFTLKMWKR